ncbi:MAG: hypothetical protein QXP77_01775 [Candidatus Aenigmatarchaeota archaeon]
MMKNLWISKIIDDKKVLEELSRGKIKILERDFRCILCKGSRFLCGKARCPILVRLYA